VSFNLGHPVGGHSNHREGKEIGSVADNCIVLKYVLVVLHLQLHSLHCEPVIVETVSTQ